MEPARKQGFLSILWNNVKGELKRSVQAGEYEGPVSLVFSNATRQVLLVAFGPVLGSVLSPLGDYVVRTGFTTIRRSYDEWTRGQYIVETKKSGITVLKSPELVAPRRGVARLPDRLEIPTATLLKPTPDYLFKPTFNLSSFSTTSRRLIPLEKGMTPMEALLSRNVSRPGVRPSVFSNPSTLSRLDPNYRGLTDIVYPGWVFRQPALQSTRLSQGIAPAARPLLLNRQPSLRSTAKLQVIAPSDRPDFWKWYLSEPQRATQFRQASRSIASSAPEPDRRGFWEKLADKIDEVLDDLDF